MSNSLDNTLPARDLTLSFVSARAQKEHEKQHEALHLMSFESVKRVGSRPAVVCVLDLYNNCHLYDCWPLAGRDEYVEVRPLPRLGCLLPIVFQAGFSCRESL